jgi:hypothetical protein
MTTLETLKACHALVWTRRQKLGRWWPTPDPLNSLRFAVTEASEALDAWLRLKGGYVRNHDKDMSVEDELADCAMMLLTAMGPTEPQRSGSIRPSSLVSSLEMIVAEVAKNLTEHMRHLEWDANHPDYPQCADVMIKFRCQREFFRIAARVDDLPARLTTRLDRIAWKQVKQWSDYWPTYIHWVYDNYRFGYDGTLPFDEWCVWAAKDTDAEDAQIAQAGAVE